MPEKVPGDAGVDLDGRADDHVGPADERKGLDSRMSGAASNARPINPESPLATERRFIPQSSSVIGQAGESMSASGRLKRRVATAMAPRWARLCQGRGGDQGGLAIALLNPDRRKTWREAMGALTPPESRFHIMTLLIAIAGFAIGARAPGLLQARDFSANRHERTRRPPAASP